ncbi:hypothetical protein ACLG6S_11050 [Thermodesulfobacteriota bacterium B35]
MPHFAPHEEHLVSSLKAGKSIDFGNGFPGLIAHQASIAVIATTGVHKVVSGENRKWPEKGHQRQQCPQAGSASPGPADSPRSCFCHFLHPVTHGRPVSSLLFHAIGSEKSPFLH